MALLPLLACFDPLGNTASAEEAWRANWIGVAGDSSATEAASTPPNTWACFRKQFSLEDAPERAELRIACDSKYWLWVNGELAVFEGQLKRGPNPEDTYFDRVDVSGLLKPGPNTLAVLVWHFGKHGMSHKNSGRLGLIVDGNIDGTRLVTDASWKAVVHPAYENTGPPHPNWRLPESNIRYDARRALGGWTSPAFDDSEWPTVETLGMPSAAPWNRLVERSIPQWRRSEIKEYESITELPAEDGKSVVHLTSLPYNAQITPYFEIDAPEGRVIDIRTDNYRGGGETNVRSEYVTRAGVQRYESLGWMNGHTVQYTLPAGVEVVRLGYRESGYNADLSGSFECDDPFLNRLWQKAQRTLYLEMRDGFVDCPGRERAQWWGDITLEIEQCFYGLDPSSRLLGRKAIHELCGWQRADGTLFSPIPAGNWDKELPLQMLASVGSKGFGTYYLHSGDEETLRQVYPAVRRYVLDVWRLREDGLVEQRKGGWTWGDWGQHKDMPLLYNCWYYLALDGLKDMATLTEKPEDAAECEQRMQSIRDRFNDTYWHGDCYRSPKNTGEIDDRGNAMAVICGFAKPTQYPALRKLLDRQRHASPYMEKYVLQALFEMGYQSDAIRRMKSRFRKMVESDLTTLWEGWGIGVDGFGGGSYNHAWSGGPLVLLSQYVAGVRPTLPGYDTYEVMPVLGSLSEVHATVPSIRGPIEVHVSDRAETFELRLSSPDNTVAVVGIPINSQESVVRVNGATRWPQPAGPPTVDGVQTLGLSDGAIKFSVPPGKWTFQRTL
ncbi:MAG: alpha-L-rhamnosidase C-terminal domain-containing protein [Planctomycetota bacterium]